MIKLFKVCGGIGGRAPKVLGKRARGEDLPEEKKLRNTSRHALNLVRRESLAATGVLDVISFDEETIIAETELGMLIIKGINLHVNRLNLENGELAVDGEISGINYEESGGYVKGSRNLLGKLFR